MYRDETEAALARIAELENQVNELRAQVGKEEALRSRVNELEGQITEARRDSVRLQADAVRELDRGGMSKLGRAGQITGIVLAVVAALVGGLCVAGRRVNEMSPRYPDRDSAENPFVPPDATDGFHALDAPWTDLVHDDPLQLDLQLEVSEATHDLEVCSAYGEGNVVATVFLAPNYLTVSIGAPHGGTPLGDCVRDVLSVVLAPRVVKAMVKVVAHVSAAPHE